jgi:hypothetical protein
VSWQEELNTNRLKTKGWYGCIAPDGWKDIVLETDEMLAYIDPDYEIHQIKEKFGTLRYYYGSEHNFSSIQGKIMYAITQAAEARSSRTCEVCGKYGELDTSKYYIRTLCEEHLDKQ